MATSETERNAERLEARDDRIMAMTLAEILTVYICDHARLLRILELRESIVRNRAESRF